MFAIGRLVLAALSGMALASAAVAQDTAPETRVGGANFDSPSASLDQMDWLVGKWSGIGIGGAPAMESWLPPSGGTMVGTFVQTTKGEDGADVIMFTEHLYLMEEAGTLVLRLKHFNADLTGWEEKDGMLTFRLVAIEPCAAYFQALTLRCDGPDGLVAAVRMKSDKPEPQELVFRFERAKPTQAGVVSCHEATNTMAMNDCFAAVLEKAEKQRAEYLAAALARHADRPALLAKIKASDDTFTAYRDAECGAVLEDWIEGTIRGVMTLSCRIDMTNRRTHTIWQNWLQFQDSTPPVLPEPQPTR